MEVSNRPFSAGSRQAPDPYDQFLEREGFYRKHTARDSTCLFRVISEQVFDVQLYHEKVRADCVNFMRKRRDLYEKKINGNFDDYLDEMSKYRSYGSFMELNALAHVFRRNVLLFEPYNCGKWFVKCDSYEDTLMVFFSPDKHFDSIFPTTYIEQAAYCQALVYEILYVKVFKLPDVMYSVERMLHDPEGRSMRIVERKETTGDMIEDRIVTSEGRQFILNTAEETECVLDNYRLCHFHNKENFASIVDIYRNKRTDKETKEIRSIRTNNTKGPLSKDLILVNPMLCDKKISCVRQLLKEGITPFPYKVAKALDPSIYRNIEFDSWSDMRRELKYRNWYFGGNSLQVGVKCMVRLNESDDHLLYCYIQEMKPNHGPCVVYIEDIAECRTVPYERLQPLPPDQIRPWVLPCKSRKTAGVHQMKILTNHPTKKKMHSKVIDVSLSKVKSLDDEYNVYSTCCGSEKSFCYTLNNFTSMHDFHPAPVEMVVMPFMMENNKNNKAVQAKNEQPKIEKNENNMTQTDVENTDCSSGFYDMYSTSSIPCSSQSFCYSYSEPLQFPYDPVASSTFYAQPYPAQSYTFAPQPPYPCPFYGPPNPMLNTMMMPQPNPPSSAVKNSDGVPNFHANQSVAANGSDLPLNDLITLRYFFNLGIDYFRQNQFRMHPPVVPAITEAGNSSAFEDSSKDDGNEVRQLATDFESNLNIRSNVLDDESNLQQKTRGTISLSAKPESHLACKRKYNCSAKVSKKNNEFTSSRSKGSTSDAGPSAISPIASNKHTTHSAASNTGSESGHEFIQTIPYSLPVYSQSPAYSVGIPYYAVDSNNVEPMMASQGACYLPTYMVHPYGAVMAPAPQSGLIAPPTDMMMMHENIPSASTRNAPEALGSFSNGNGYPPMVYAPSQATPGYTVWGYPQQHPMVPFNSNTNNGNGSGNAPQ